MDPGIMPYLSHRADASVALPIEQNPLGEQVYALLRQRIASGELRPGEKLSDLRLSTEMGVSRTPVREALHRLAQDGIVRVLPRRGFAVVQLCRRDVQELYEIRLGLEVVAVRLGGPRLGAETLSALRQAHDMGADQVTAIGAVSAAPAFFEIDHELHRALFHATRNRRLVAMREAIQAQLDVLPVYGLPLEAMVLLSLDHHAAMLGALERRDWAGAEAAMALHICEMQEQVLAAFDESDAS